MHNLRSRREINAPCILFAGTPVLVENMTTLFAQSTAIAGLSGDR